MSLFERLSKLTPEQRRLLEQKLKQQGVDIPRIPISPEYRTHYPGGFPLTSEQEPMWVIEKMDPDNPSYNAPGTVRLQGDLNPALLERSIAEVVKRHEILRTIFITNNGKPVQVIQSSLTLPLERIDLKDLPSEEQEKRLKQLREDKELYTFDIARGPLLRTVLIERSVDTYILITIMHHIIGDLLSLKMFLKEVALYYRFFLPGPPRVPPLPALSFHYVDYACWQRYWYRESLLGREIRDKQEQFWLEMFGEDVPVLNLPADYPRPPLKSYEGEHLFFTLEGDETGILKEISLKENSTLSGILLAVYYVFLTKISGQEDIVVGSPVNTRQTDSLKNMVGLFVRTVPMRNHPRGDKTFREFLTEVNTRLLNAFENQDYSYEELVGKTLKERDAGRNPLFDVLFNFIYIDMSEIDMPGLEVKPYRFQPKRVGFDLELTCEGTYKELFLKFSYCVKLFKAETIRRFISYFRKIVETVIKDPGVHISEIDIIPEEEKKKLLYEFNDTVVDYPEEKTVIQSVDGQVLKNPGSIAAVFANHFLTYGELQKAYNRLAEFLKSKGVGPEVIVGLMTERSIEMLVGMLGILKAGGAYLPVGSDMPQERIDYMLADSGAKIVLTARDLENEVLDSATTCGQPPLEGARAACYVIYTSGSTGKPKGVTITHRNVMNFMHGMNSAIGFFSGKAILALTTLSFDIHVLETLLPLTQGLKVVIASEEEQRNPQLLALKAAAECLNMVQLTPSTLQLLVAANIDLICLKDIEILMIGGEPFPRELLERLKAGYHGRIFNMYGPTETTVWSTVKELTAAKSITVGYPISNTRIYILDRYGKLQPTGVPGELYIGGDGVARGYLNKPELTSERFINILAFGDPLFEKSGAKTFPEGPSGLNKSFLGVQGAIFQKSPLVAEGTLYRTGDLARWLEDSDIEFLGRLDHQVKIRGFRIELEEIETHLKRHEGISESVVIVKSRDSDEHFLCAYYVPGNPGRNQGELVSELRGFLAARLPDYMVPAFFVPIEKIPLTPNKKTDRKALAGYPINQPHVESYQVPKTGLEKKVAACWKKVLKIDNIGLHDNFFELGGNSASVIQLNNELKKALSRDVHVALMYRYVTISAFSRYLREAAGKSTRQVQTGPVEVVNRQKTLFDSAIRKTIGVKSDKSKR